MRLFAIFALAAVTYGLEVPESELANGVQPLDDEAMVEVECQGEECNVNDDDNSLVEEEADEETRAIRVRASVGLARLLRLERIQVEVLEARGFQGSILLLHLIYYN